VRLPLGEPIPSHSCEEDPSRCGDFAIDADLERIWEQEWERNLLEAAIERVKQRFDPRQFQLFDLLVLQQWPTNKVRSVLNVGRTYMYVARHRISKAVKNELIRIKKEAF